MRYKIVYFFILFTLIVTACKSKNEELVEKINENGTHFIKTNFLELKKTNESAGDIDSIKFIKIDTVTEKMNLVVLHKNLDNKYETFKEKAEEQSGITRGILREMQIYSMLGDKSLLSLSNKDFEESNKKYKLLVDSMKLIDSKMERIIDLYEKSDSVKLVNYRAKFLVKRKLKDKSIASDSLYIYFDLDKNPIKIPEYIKILNEKYK